MAPLEAKYRGGTGADTRRNTHFFRLEKLGRRGKLDLNRYISTLRITQGEGTGEPLRLFHWERRFLRGAMKPDVSTAALTVARGNGKTTLSAALAVAALDGPLVQKRAEIVLVASSFGQAKILFEHCLAFLEPVIIRDGEGKHGRWRIQDSANLATIEDRRTGAMGTLQKREDVGGAGDRPREDSRLPFGGLGNKTVDPRSLVLKDAAPGRR